METKRYLLNVPILREKGDQTFKIAPREDKSTLIIGQVGSAFYFICFIVIYFTAFANCDKTGPFKYWGTDSRNITKTAYNKCSGLIGAKSMNQSLTLSYMLLYSNRYLSTLLITVACILMAIVFIKQNFGVFDENDGRIFCVIGPFILAFLLNSLLLFGPTEHSSFHFLAAGTIILMGTLFCGISYALYMKYYRNPSEEEMKTEIKAETEPQWGNFEDLKILTILISISAIIAFMGAFMMYNLKIKMKSGNSYHTSFWLTDKILGVTEIVNLILIGIFILQVSKKPPLLVNNFCAFSV